MSESRRKLVRLAKDDAGQPLWNGIDYVEVELPAPKKGGVSRSAGVDRASLPTLKVHCIHAITDSVSQIEAIIEGGVRITGIGATVVSAKDDVLTVEASAVGDFSTYTLRLVAPGQASHPPERFDPPAGFDPVLSQVAFSFRAACPTDFDCRSAPAPASAPAVQPEISYLAKDYGTFRQLMLDRMSVLMPSWKERSPADVQIMLVELLAYVADQLSYYQDAVATEAYLGTARQRVSIRRHARLLDYPMHEGCNARTWVMFEVEPGSDADGNRLLEGTQVLTQGPSTGTVVSAEERDAVLAKDQSVVFETMQAIELYAARNAILFYHWRDDAWSLPVGATSATLMDKVSSDGTSLLALAQGQILVFHDDSEGASTHVVQLTKVYNATHDPVTGTALVDIEWDPADALPFAITSPQAFACGNVALCDHGFTIDKEALDPPMVPQDGRYRPRLRAGPLTFAAPLDLTSTSASAFLSEAPHAALPCLRLTEKRHEKHDDEHPPQWVAVRDLLASDEFSRELVVEMDNDGVGQLRFGDGVSGLAPAPDLTLLATYRVGNGAMGNVGAGTLTRVVAPFSGILSVRNPLPATGGTEPETLEQVRQLAPQAFRTQERAVTEADYAEVAQRQAGVQKAEARLRWTGSWHTAFVTIDRSGGQPVDKTFKDSLGKELDRYRMAGQDVEVDGPTFVPLDLSLRVCVAAGYFRSTVEAALLSAFSAGTLPSGQRGFFHPDNFTFGQPVYLSQIYAAAMATPGVSSVQVTRFQRLGAAPSDELERGVLETGSVEIVELANDPNFPENGRLVLTMVGGL